jgi:8-amino-7-oxononanoate synthase
MRRPSAVDESFLEDALRGFDARGLFRKIRYLERLDPVHGMMDKKPVMLFCGNDYLGLSFHPRVIAAFKKAADLYGTGAGAARLTSGSSSFHELLERKLAGFKNKERALVFSAGYMANVGVLTALAGAEDLIVMDKLCHASLVDGARLSGAAVRIYPHGNYGRCEDILEKNENFRRKIIVSESVYSMDGDVADPAELVRIKDKHGCLLIVDDAHGTGVLGPTGRGACEGEDNGDKIDVLVATLSKALGCCGGFAAASDRMVQYLINCSRPFLFSTALPPAVCAAAVEAVSVLEEDRSLHQRLWENVRRMRSGLESVGVNVSGESPIFPIILGDERRALRLSEKLLEQGYWVPAIRPPTVPKGKSRLRLTVSAAHNNEDIDCFLRSFGRFFNENE